METLVFFFAVKATIDQGIFSIDRVPREK